MEIDVIAKATGYRMRRRKAVTIADIHATPGPVKDH
jgi:hypothetical protein